MVPGFISVDVIVASDTLNLLLRCIITSQMILSFIKSLLLSILHSMYSISTPLSSWHLFFSFNNAWWCYDQFVIHQYNPNYQSFASPIIKYECVSITSFEPIFIHDLFCFPKMVEAWLFAALNGLMIHSQVLSLGWYYLNPFGMIMYMSLLILKTPLRNALLTCIILFCSLLWAR